MPSSLRFVLSFKAVAIVATALSCTLATASSPAAWSAHDRDMAAACEKASGLKQAKAAGKPMIYSDQVGLTALLVSGRYPQPHMKNHAGRVLCLYDREKRQAAVVEADQLSVRPAPSATR